MNNPQQAQTASVNANNHHIGDSTFDKMTNLAHEYGEKISKMTDEAKEQAVELSKSFENLIKENPFTSIGIAVLGGILLSALLKD